MFRHLLKLIWKRKGRNLMLSLEIMLAFVLVFGIAAFGARSWQLYGLPLGFQYTDVWSVEIHSSRDAPLKNDAQMYDQLTRTLRGMPEVEEVAFTSYAPYTMSSSTNDFERPDGSGRINTGMLEVSDNFFNVSGMTLLSGSWFSSADDGLAATPVVINSSLAEALFPGQPAVGKQFSNSPKGDKAPHMLRVSAVIEDYRKRGEFMAPDHFMLLRFVPGGAGTGPRGILLKLKPGTPRSFEAPLQRQLKAVQSEWSYTISPLPELRRSMHKIDMVPLIVLSVIAGFLLLMVAFGLFGVLWQNTTRRIPEIGLRRAIGASAGDIYRQIIGEQLMLSSVAMAAGLLLLVQLPLTGALGASLDWRVFFAAAGLSIMLIYLLSLLCSVYPGWRASRLSPTEALHYE